MSKEIALILTGAIVPIGVWLCILHYRFLNILELGHQENWVEMGEPKVLFSKTVGSEFSISRLLFSAKYRSLQDPMLTMVGNDLRLAHILFLSSIFGSFVFNIFAL